MKKAISIVLALSLVFGLASCGKKNENNDTKNTTNSTVVEKDNSKEETNNESETAKSNHYPVTITTYNYSKEPVEITVEKEPEKVVAVYQNSIETLLALGLEDKIVAASGLDHEVKPQWKKAFEGVNYLTEFTPSKETVVMLEPDFILSWYSIFSDKRLGDVDYWHNKGVNTYMSLNSGAAAIKTLDNEYTDILNMGKVFNVEDKAQAIVDEITNEVERVSKAVEKEEQKTALIVEIYKDYIRTYGKTTLGGDMVTQLGAEVLSPEGGKISEEGLVNLNPNTIFVVYMDRENEDVATESVNKIMNNPALASLKAVKEESVHAIQLGEMYASGVRTIDGINKFAKGLYPHLYEEK
ncbi:ABC transporter substrate-binding protein [Oceanirhabdus seepicola]|uniref:ABC transporter substrate-binding protein n=1 Tax=Oceanirhabdus seepicola TaxID=2828781 RepID=A0A9J6P8V5_9CLOT|nr:ABC transporter substrate-binding protein [Oceanirhabdus seepicola]MCM1991856.1 ABC transporter substrate-binding protein [Oceanirhabdus seepicola]